MPYRALMWTLVTVGLAFLTVGMWMRAVQPMMAEHGTQEMTVLVKGTLLLAFVLIGMLLIVGLLGAYREWMRYRGRKGKQTKYVDAWKIAGERLKMKESEDE